MTPKPEKEKLTTIALSHKTKSLLKKLKKDGSFESAILRLMNQISDVYIDFVLVDNELPHTHTLVFQLGKEKGSLYLFDGENYSPISLEDAQKLIKQPKPNMTINEEEAANFLHLITKPGVIPAIPEALDLTERLKSFLKAHKPE